MKSTFLSLVLSLLAGAVLFSASASAQTPMPQPRRGGFDRPLAESNRFGNPGASPKLTMVEFRALLAHWQDFDANKNLLLEKSEVPELFWRLFDQADLNHDGVLDAEERVLLVRQPAAPAPVPSSPSASVSK